MNLGNQFSKDMILDLKAKTSHQGHDAEGQGLTSARPILSLRLTSLIVSGES